MSRVSVINIASLIIRYHSVFFSLFLSYIDVHSLSHSLSSRDTVFNLLSWPTVIHSATSFSFIFHVFFFHLFSDCSVWVAFPLSPSFNLHRLPSPPFSFTALIPLIPSSVNFLPLISHTLHFTSHCSPSNSLTFRHYSHHATHQHQDFT